MHGANADFAAYATYEWMESNDVPQIPEIRRYLIDQIEAQLGSAGLKKVETDGDLKVGIRMGATIESTSSSAYATPETWSIGFPLRGDRSITETTMIVDVIDAAANHAIWQGFAAKTFHDQDRMDYGRLRKKVDKLVSAMFRDFPPKPKK